MNDDFEAKGGEVGRQSALRSRIWTRTPNLRRAGNLSHHDPDPQIDAQLNLVGGSA